MRTPVLVLSVTTLLLALTGCSTHAPAPIVVPSAVAASPEPDVLLAGTTDRALRARTYYSPTDFVPPLALPVPAGWHSAHRGDDAFDLSRPGPGGAAALVVIAFVTPKDDTVTTALARLQAAARGRVTPASGTVAGQPATGFEEVGGSGRLVASPSGTVLLDALPAGRLRVLGADLDGVPLLEVVLVPDAARWAQQQALADTLLRGITSG